MDQYYNIFCISSLICFIMSSVVYLYIRITSPKKVIFVMTWPLLWKDHKCQLMIHINNIIIVLISSSTLAVLMIDKPMFLLRQNVIPLHTENNQLPLKWPFFCSCFHGFHHSLSQELEILKNGLQVGNCLHFFFSHLHAASSNLWSLWRVVMGKKRS